MHAHFNALSVWRRVFTQRVGDTFATFAESLGWKLAAIEESSSIKWSTTECTNLIHLGTLI